MVGCQRDCDEIALGGALILKGAIMVAKKHLDNYCLQLEAIQKIGRFTVQDCHVRCFRTLLVSNL